MPFLALLLAAALAQQQPPALPPFPQPRTPAPQRPAAPPPSTTKPTPPAPATPPATPPAATAPRADKPAGEAAPSEAVLGVPVYPGAQFIGSYDAGRGQRYYIFGTTAAFVDLVSYYKTVLKRNGNMVFDVPATHTFEVGRFRDETMAFPPGVTVKDYQTEVSAGFPNPKPGGTPARFPTLIQIVPATEQ
jgi:hypothetical protein